MLDYVDFWQKLIEFEPKPDGLCLDGSRIPLDFPAMRQQLNAGLPGPHLDQNKTNQQTNNVLQSPRAAADPPTRPQSNAAQPGSERRRNDEIPANNDQQLAPDIGLQKMRVPPVKRPSSPPRKRQRARNDDDDDDDHLDNGDDNDDIVIQLDEGDIEPQPRTRTFDDATASSASGAGSSKEIHAAASRKTVDVADRSGTQGDALTPRVQRRKDHTALHARLVKDQRLCKRGNKHGVLKKQKCDDFMLRLLQENSEPVVTQMIDDFNDKRYNKYFKNMVLNLWRELKGR
eukprot:TRINITY_DN3767_c0_g1_i2.p1 TRINITY_DN3767_c0_g1~~TRINITY_DN3767_c0_g1_i2.p1  ORF type:complete len:288 (-),score=51.16 TRINITY_DN3767_c0_g1_i2:32-895(-)